ncbi:MAG: response regulator [Bdellovibrionaceae bacterium]|jgi:two-component system, chemotaxis family, chemotaxis protein CheY|nr:response regulator [Pseudobdellovibrionaceae bacterium]
MFNKDTKILIVDDLKTIRSILTEILWKIGFTTIDEAENGKEALKKIQEAYEEGTPYGLIFCDWNMPEYTGIDLLNAKNSIPSIKDTPFIMVTIESERSYVLKAVTLGVDDFIVKPFDEVIILKKLKSVWERLNE